MLANVHIVLVNTSHPGNIGSTARAMKVMGFKKLLLVNPKKFPSPEADALAVGCKDVLENAEVYTSLSKAIENNIVNIGLSARSRKATIPSLHIDECVDLIIKNSNITYNLIFGNESSGLSNEDLLKCDYILTLPTDKEYTSLNLAASVQILVYELFKNSFKSKLNNKKLSTLAKSKEKISLSFSFSGTSLLPILIAKPSTIAVFPTPGSPTKTGLFFVLLDKT